MKKFASCLLLLSAVCLNAATLAYLTEIQWRTVSRIPNPPRSKTLHRSIRMVDTRSSHDPQTLPPFPCILARVGQKSPLTFLICTYTVPPDYVSLRFLRREYFEKKNTSST